MNECLSPFSSPSIYRTCQLPTYLSDLEPVCPAQLRSSSHRTSAPLSAHTLYLTDRPKRPKRPTDRPINALFIVASETCPLHFFCFRGSPVDFIILLPGPSLPSSPAPPRLVSRTDLKPLLHRESHYARIETLYEGCLPLSLLYLRPVCDRMPRPRYRIYRLTG